MYRFYIHYTIAISKTQYITLGGVNLKKSLKYRDTISFKNIIGIVYPVILSMFSLNIMTFIDRAFVSKSSLAEFAAIVPASNLATSISSIFIGIIGFGTVLISQYYGAKNHANCSRVLCNSIYLSIVFSFLLIIMSPAASRIFILMGHSGSLLKYERQFFYIIMFSSCFQLLSTAFSNFFKGINNTKIPMFVGIAANIINILLDYIFIFGKFGFYKLGGILGSGLSTLLSCFISVLIYIFLVNQKRFKVKYEILKAIKLDKTLIVRLLHFGFPTGIQTFIGTGYFSLLLLIIGKTGQFNLACSNIAFTIEGISILPVQGIGIAISIIVGREIGAGRIENVKSLLKKGLLLGFFFNLIIIFVFNFFPITLISLFNSSDKRSELLSIQNCTIHLIRITSAWIIFDTIQIIIGNVLKSAGDTFFMMAVYLTIPFIFYIVLPYAICVIAGLNIYWVWVDLLVFTLIMLTLVSVRFIRNKWKDIRVI